MTNKESLTQEHLKSVLHYDPETGVFTWIDSKCKRISAGTTGGTLHKSHKLNYLRMYVKDKNYLCHRLAWLYVHGEWPNEIDHIDGDGLNNKITNLRNVSSTENGKNLSIRNDNKSGIIGVSWMKSRSKWQANINSNKKQVYLGIYDDFFEACCVRKSAEYELGFHANHGRA